MHTEEDIRQYFHEVKERFFPGWDPRGVWELAFEPSPKAPGATGYCCSRTRTIYLRPGNSSVLQMCTEGAKALLVHEVCHDVTTASHGRRWVDRMRQAASRADELGDRALAEQIRSSSFADMRPGNDVDLCHDTVSEYVCRLLKGGKALGCAEAIRAAASHFGVSSRRMRDEFAEIIEECMERQ